MATHLRSRTGPGEMTPIVNDNAGHAVPIPSDIQYRHGQAFGSGNHSAIKVSKQLAAPGAPQ